MTVKTILTAVASFAILTGCDSVLDPMKSGHYTDENIDEYPSIMRGFVNQAYSLWSTNTYNTREYIEMDCATDDGVLTAPNAVIRKFSEGALSPSEDPFLTFWTRDYQGIYYCNRFLKNRQGYNTQYLVGRESDLALRRAYQGDAYALRASFTYDLLSKFAGKDSDGHILGVPVIDGYFEQSEVSPDSWTRASFDDCVKQIIKDCDSALVYLPVGNRDWLAKDTQVEGSQRWQKFDQQSVTAIKALTYLLWASDAFNPSKDVKRWELAATEAYKVIRFKLTEDGAHGFDPLAAYDFLDPNNKDAVWISRYSGKTSTMETSQYPEGFRGSATYAPTQDLVDAFPMANGYPITDSRSGYDPENPYVGRDPRFYATIFYNGAQALRGGKAGDAMYTFEMWNNGGKDLAGLQKNSLTNYYLKKHLYMGWNGSDQTVLTMPRSVVRIGWRDMVFAFAEASNRAVGPSNDKFGISAKDALSYIRKRKTFDGAAGLGSEKDPYLDECATDKDKFETLLRNERRIEFCFEGRRFFDLTRWGIPLSERNKAVHRADITRNDDGSFKYGTSEIYRINLKSAYLPIPYTDMQRAAGLVQNEGWSSWSRQ